MVTGVDPSIGAELESPSSNVIPKELLEIAPFFGPMLGAEHDDLEDPYAYGAFMTSSGPKRWVARNYKTYAAIKRMPLYRLLFDQVVKVGRVDEAEQNPVGKNFTSHNGKMMWLLNFLGSASPQMDTEGIAERDIQNETRRLKNEASKTRGLIK